MRISKNILNILYNINDKIISRKYIKGHFSNVLQSKSEKIISSLRRAGYIKYVFNGFYYIVSPEERETSFMKYTTNEMLFAVLNKSNINWYMGLDSALELNNLSWTQTSKKVIINSKISGKRKVMGVEYLFHKIKNKLTKFGYKERITKNRIKFYYSTIEKTYLDYIYLRKRVPVELKEKVKHSKVKELLINYSKSFKKKVMFHE